MTDLTAAVEAATRALGEHQWEVRASGDGRSEPREEDYGCSCGNEYGAWVQGVDIGAWDPDAEHGRHIAAAAVAAAAPILRAQVLAEAREAVEEESLHDDPYLGQQLGRGRAFADALAAIDALGAERAR